LKAIADLNRDTASVDRITAAISMLNHSIAEVDRRIHHIRVYYFDVLLARDAVRLEIAKMQQLLYLLKSDWKTNGCNCGNTTCFVPKKFPTTGSVPIPISFFEGAVCQYYCRKNAITTVDICNCSVNEAWQDDVRDDLLELFRINRTITREAADVEQIVDLTNSTGLMKHLLDIRAEWVAKRDALVARSVRLISDVITDLRNATILEEICDLIHHCNVDRHVNCTCVFDVVHSTLSCTHIVLSTGSINSDIAYPDRCHNASISARIGDSVLSHFVQSSSSGATTVIVGDQDPDPVNLCLSREKRTILSSGSTTMVQTSSTLPNPGNGNSSGSAISSFVVGLVALSMFLLA